MKGGFWRGVVFAVMLSPTVGGAMTMSLPLWMGGRELGEIPVALSGMEVSAVSLATLQATLGGRVSKATWQSLASQVAHSPDGMIALSSLATSGITLSFDDQTLSLSALIATDAMGEIGVNFADSPSEFIPSATSNFSWLNSFNLSHTENWQDNNQSQTSNLDWLAQFNIGGARGLNISTANYFEVQDEGSTFLRGEWTAFYDRPDLPMRVSLGDVTPSTSGFLSSLNLGGIAIESDYAALQPDRVIGPNNNQLLILQESAEIDVSVNGQIIYSGRQEAGRFNLSNLPLNNGANDIIVYVRYLSGKTERLVFSQFYNSTLLQEGVVNYSISAGAPSAYGEQGIEYLPTWFSSAFIDYGWTSWLTLGANASAGEYGQGLGVTATFGTNIGNLSARAAVSNTDGSGAIYGLNFESTILGASESNTPNLRIALEFANNHVSALWDETAIPLSYERALVNYVWSINSAWDVSLSGSYYNIPEKIPQINSSATLNWRRGNKSLGAGISYTESEDYPEGNQQIFLSFDWYFSFADKRLNAGASYITTDNRSRLDLSRSNNDRVGSMGMRAQIEYDDFVNRELGQFNYTGNRARWEAQVERFQVNDGESDANYSASIRANTAVGLVGDSFGWGRAQTGPFLVAKLHPTLADSELQLKVSQEGEYTAAGYGHIAGLVPLDNAYSTNAIDINVPDAPLGYDWGVSRLSISPGAATGHLVQVGSDSSYTLTGVLLDTAGNPLVYSQGDIQANGQTLSFFTNNAGRFYIAGVSPGVYQMRINSDKCESLTVNIEAGKASLIQMGTLSISCIKENDDESL